MARDRTWLDRTICSPQEDYSLACMTVALDDGGLEYPPCEGIPWRLGKKLQERHITVYVTEDRWESRSLGDRISQAEKVYPLALVGIGIVEGSEISGANFGFGQIEISRAGRVLADRVSKAWRTFLGQDLQVIPARLRRLQRTRFPALFLWVPGDPQIRGYMDPISQDRIARALTEGICSFLRDRESGSTKKP